MYFSQEICNKKLESNFQGTQALFTSSNNTNIYNIQQLCEFKLWADKTG